MPGPPLRPLARARWGSPATLCTQMRERDSHGQGHQVLVQWPLKVANVFSHLPSCPTGTDSLEPRLGRKEVQERQGGRPAVHMPGPVSSPDT